MSMPTLLAVVDTPPALATIATATAISAPAHLSTATKHQLACRFECLFAPTGRFLALTKRRTALTECQTAPTERQLVIAVRLLARLILCQLVRQLTTTMSLHALQIMLTKPKHPALQRQNPNTTHQVAIHSALLAIQVVQFIPNPTIKLTVLARDLTLAVLTITKLVVLTIMASMPS